MRIKTIKSKLEFSVEWSHPTAFQGCELEVAKNPLERSKVSLTLWTPLKEEARILMEE